MTRQHPKKTLNKKSVTGVLAPRESLSINDKIIRFLSNKRNQILLIVVIICAFYSNSVNNAFAFDDQQYYFANQFVLKGVSGIHDLFTKESMYGFSGQYSSLSGGRWRPLSLITFALETEYFHGNPHVSHTINMLLLILTGVIMLLFLRKYLFTLQPVAAFLVVLLFIIHPVHTDAVSHIKSRDELLSWLFLLLTIYCSLNFLTKKNYWQLLLAVVFYFLALLSKENGITFIIILPLTFYFFTKAKLRSIVLTTVPFAVVLGVYALMRFSFVAVLANAGTNILYAPYAFATPVQRIATQLMLLGKYILLLFWPNPLICDYSYGAISYVNFSDWRVWVSILIQSALVIYAVLKLKEKNLVSYGILFYFCSIFIVSNIVIDVGAFIGERFLYQPSFGFCVAVVVAGNELFKKINFKTAAQKLSVLFALITVVVVLSGFQTIQRNNEWSDNETLFTSDVKKVPNSFLVHESLGNIFMIAGIHDSTRQQQIDDYNRSLAEFDTANNIYGGYIIVKYNIGAVDLRMGNNEDAKRFFLKCIAEDSDYLMPYSGMGSAYYQEKNYEEALIYYKKGIQKDSANPLSYFNMGLCYHMLGQYEQEIQCYKKTLSFNLTPIQLVESSLNLQTIKQNLANAEGLLQNENNNIKKP